MQSVLTWPYLTAIVAVGAGLLLVFLLRSRRPTAGEVRIKPMANPKPRSVRARGAIFRKRSPGVPARFEGMDGAQFEAEVAGLLRELGYTVRSTPPSGVHDVDLLLEATSRKVAVQLKRWKAPVGDRSVYALFTGRIHYATDEAWLITTSEFTRKAVKLAGTTGVRLVDGVELAEWLTSREERLSSLSGNDPKPPTQPVPAAPRYSEVLGSAAPDGHARGQATKAPKRPQ